MLTEYETSNVLHFDVRLSLKARLMILFGHRLHICIVTRCERNPGQTEAEIDTTLPFCRFRTERHAASAATPNRTP